MEKPGHILWEKKKFSFYSVKSCKEYINAQ